MLAGLLSAFALLLCLIEPSYRETSHDTRNSVKYTADYFFFTESDEEKFKILTANENKWRHIKDDVKAWLEEKLSTWLESSPPWLTDYNRSLIPEWAIDDKSLLSRIRNKAVEALLQDRRRSSFVGLNGAATNVY